MCEWPWLNYSKAKMLCWQSVVTAEAFWPTDRVNFKCPTNRSTLYFKNMSYHNIPKTIRGSWTVTIQVSHRSKLSQDKNTNKVTPPPEQSQISQCQKVGCSLKLWHMKHANEHFDLVWSLPWSNFMVSCFFKIRPYRGHYMSTQPMVHIWRFWPPQNLVKKNSWIGIHEI